MTVTDNVKKILFIFIALLAFQTAQAQLEIEIISGNASALPIAIVPFQWLDAGPPPIDGVDSIVSGDLYRSGLFDPMAVEEVRQNLTDLDPRLLYTDWREMNSSLFAALRWQTLSL